MLAEFADRILLCDHVLSVHEGKKAIFKMEKLLDFFILTKSNQVHENKKSLDVMFAFLDSSKISLISCS